MSSVKDIENVPNLLLQGIDTIECSYYLYPKGSRASFNYEQIALERERMRSIKQREPSRISIGGQDFLLYPYGNKSGFPFMMESEDAVISFGEFNNPSFFVKFKSIALWRESAIGLHEKFMSWASTVGLAAYREESLSRVDFSFDYDLPEVDFDEGSFLSLAKKDCRYRKNGQVQTLQFGMGDVVLRVYDKVAEIREQSGKTWFYELWGADRDVWRIEWQVRKAVLKRFSIRTFDDLVTGQGDVLRYLATEHTTLRKPSDDTNRSRWPMHPLWMDLEREIALLDKWGVYRSIDNKSLAEEKIARIAVSINGYLKRIAAIDCVLHNKPMLSKDDALTRASELIDRMNDTLSWQADVEKRIDQIRAGKW